MRTIHVAIPPVTHSARDKAGFIPVLIKIARDTGVSGPPAKAPTAGPPATPWGQLPDWQPVHPGLIADLEDGHYFSTG